MAGTSRHSARAWCKCCLINRANDRQHSRWCVPVCSVCVPRPRAQRGYIYIYIYIYMYISGGPRPRAQRGGPRPLRAATAARHAREPASSPPAAAAQARPARPASSRASAGGGGVRAPPVTTAATFVGRIGRGRLHHAARCQGTEEGTELQVASGDPAELNAPS